MRGNVCEKWQPLQGAKGPNVLDKLGRPGFPRGMVVLLVSNEAQESQDIAQQMVKLSYRVTTCQSCSEARQLLASKSTSYFDIVLLEASIASKDNTEGSILLDALSTLPLILLSSSTGMTECVWRGIEIGAAEVLEKPLSPHKLQNIWQHVVRRVLDVKDTTAMMAGNLVSSDGGDKADHMSVRSGKTPSSNLSTVTTQNTKLGDRDNSYSVSPEVSVDASMSNTSPSEGYTVESTANDSQAKLDWTPTRAGKRALEGQAPGSAPPTRKVAKPGLRQTFSQPLTSQARTAQTVVGTVHPSWAGTRANSQAFRGSIPPGCVWGTPLNPPPGWQAGYSNGAGPILGSAATNSSLPRYNSAPVHKLDTLSAGLDGFDSLADFDTALMGNLGDDLFLGDDFLDCEDNFLSTLSATSLANTTPEYGMEAPPIGLSLKKSESLLDLINQQLTQSQLKSVSIHSAS